MRERAKGCPETEGIPDLLVWMRQWIKEQGRGEFDVDLARTGMALDRDVAERSGNCPKFADAIRLLMPSLADTTKS
jgi:hypothetical protein